MHISIQQIKTVLSNSFERSLPGREAQMEMAAVHRHIIDVPAPPDAKNAAVLILLYEKYGQLYTVFMKRAVHIDDRHSGQISFPGGKKEDTDIDLSITAMRETEEEIGIRADDIQLMGQLTPMYIPVSGFKVSPYVGVIDYEPEFTLEVGEVQYSIEVPLLALLSPTNRQFTSIETGQGFFLKNIPCFNINEHIIWGATAMMTNEFLELIRSELIAIL